MTSETLAAAAPAAPAGPHEFLHAQMRWRWSEIAFWLATLLPFVLTPDYLILASQVAITALFALSLDLILGFSGIVSLGHAAYFGVGAYTAGLISVWGWGEPLTGLLAAGLAAGIVGYITSFVIARFRHLALIMITLGFCLLLQEAANERELAHRRLQRSAGRSYLETPRHLRFRSLWLYGLCLRARRIVCYFPRGAAHHSFAVRAGAARHS